jgi:hypothetical protein
MNKRFEEPVVEIVRLSENDIIVTSSCGGGNQLSTEDNF